MEKILKSAKVLKSLTDIYNNRIKNVTLFTKCYIFIFSFFKFFIPLSENIFDGICGQYS